MEKRKIRSYILVKAYPQTSFKYEETVCCAGITDAGEFIRLYPIRYRRLPDEAKFDRFDLVEFTGEKPIKDSRPESWHVVEDSIRIISKGSQGSPESKYRLWIDHACTLPELRQANLDRNVTLGIVRPDPGSLRFRYVAVNKTSAQDRDIAESLSHQTGLFETPLAPLQLPDYAFYYKYLSGGVQSEGQIHDWEVQATYRNYVRRYQEDALNKMADFYVNRASALNPHLILGTMLAHPRQFIIIGLLRSSVETQDGSQPRLL